MRTRPFFASLLTVMVVMSSLPSTAAAERRQPDLAREQRMADDIVEMILDGEPVDLQTARGQAFLGIFTRYSEDADGRGTAIILHGRGFHPDWVDVVQPLREGLVEHGWNTLSIQLPVLEKTAKYYDYVEIFPDAIPRIEAAVSYARANGEGMVALIAHSCGSHMAQHWLNERGTTAMAQIDAYIGIGMGATDYRQYMVEPFALDRMRMPLLDVYGAEDFPAVLRLAPERLAGMHSGGHPKNRQLAIPEADHYFGDRGDVLVDTIAAWLESL